VLTLSRYSRWYRIFAAVLWFIGTSSLVAAYKGLCIILHHSHSRNLRPWELDDPHVEQRNSDDTVQLSNLSNYDESYMDKEKDGLSRRTTSLHTFGPKNSFDDESWVEREKRKSIIRKMFERETWTQDETLRVLQDKIVLGANIWSAIITLILTIVFVALPSGNFY